MSADIPSPFRMEPRRYGDCVFTREEAEGAIPNGTLVRKCDEDSAGEDVTPIGTIGTVIGSLPAEADKLTAREKARIEPRFLNAKFFYFIEWRATPDLVIGVIDGKIEELT